MSAAFDTQTVVIGAGVVGLAVARALAMTGREVCVLEANSEIGHGISSRNSEVIHAGIYYPKDSLKARLCVAGRQLLYTYCHERHINAQAVGKLIVATSADEIDALHGLKQRAQDNGVTDIEWLNARDAILRQPQLHCVGALYSPSTGIVDSHSLMVSLQGDIENHRGMVVCQAPVQKLTAESSGFTLDIGAPSSMKLRCAELVNCAGLQAVAVANCMAGQHSTATPTARFAKGNYFKLQGKAPFDTLIYPAPVTGGLGVHLTIDLAGQARFGPDVEWLNDGAAHDYQVDPARAMSFYDAIRKYWPDLPDNSLQPDYAGIRPKLDESTDFMIRFPADHGIDGLVNLFGIESPGLTSSLAIGEYVARQLTQH